MKCFKVLCSHVQSKVSTVAHSKTVGTQDLIVAPNHRVSGCRLPWRKHLGLECLALVLDSSSWSSFIEGQKQCSRHGSRESRLPRRVPPARSWRVMCTKARGMQPYTLFLSSRWNWLYDYYLELTDLHWLSVSLRRGCRHTWWREAGLLLSGKGNARYINFSVISFIFITQYKKHDVYSF